MFVTYALATGMTLTSIGLYQAVATHRLWSRSSKWWGSLLLGLATFAGVTAISDEVSPVALVATCSCAILALSIHGQHPVDVVEAPEHIEEVEIEGTQESNELHEVYEPQEVDEPQEVYELQEAYELQVVDEPQEAYEPQETDEPVAEIEVAGSVDKMEDPVSEFDVPAVEESLEVVAVSSEYLNELLAEGYIAKGAGDYTGAVAAFERALRSCTDTGLSDMIKEELSDCYRNLPELKQGA